VERREIVGGDDGDRLEPELATGPEDAKRDLAAVRNEHA
jgi:hypothetical protein